MDMCAHLPVEDDAPDEPQGQLVVSIYNIRPSYVYQINLKKRRKRNDANAVPTLRIELETDFKRC